MASLLSFLGPTQPRYNEPIHPQPTNPLKGYPPAKFENILFPMEVLGLRTPIVVKVDGKKRVELHEVSAKPDSNVLFVVKPERETHILLQPGEPSNGYGLYVATDQDRYYRATIAEDGAMHILRYRCMICPVLKDSIDAAIIDWVTKNMGDS